MTKTVGIPRKVLDAVEKRRKYAHLFNQYDYIVSEYCTRESINTELIYGHAECLGEPDDACERTLEVLREHFKKEED